ncbi:MAG: biopolymer transporter ExbD [Pseudomonadota bacterium]
MAEFAFGPERRARRPSLTPMVDVVFLLLVFFMLAARTSADRTLPLIPPSDAEGVYAGAPRIVTVSVTGLMLNGAAVTLDGLPAALVPLMPARNSIVVLQADDTASLQEVVLVLDRLAEGGIGSVVLAE